jgi:hypothetical protein
MLIVLEGHCSGGRNWARFYDVLKKIFMASFLFFHQTRSFAARIHLAICFCLYQVFASLIVEDLFLYCFAALARLGTSQLALQYSVRTQVVLPRAIQQSWLLIVLCVFSTGEDVKTR